MRTQIQNRIKKLEAETDGLRNSLRMAEQKYLQLNYDHARLIESAVPKLRGYRLRLYLSVGLNVLLVIATIYLTLRKP